MTSCFLTIILHPPPVPCVDVGDCNHTISMMLQYNSSLVVDMPQLNKIITWFYHRRNQLYD